MRNDDRQSLFAECSDDGDAELPSTEDRCQTDHLITPTRVGLRRCRVPGPHHAAAFAALAHSR